MRVDVKDFFNWFPNIYFRTQKGIIINDDCFSVFKYIPDKSIDMILADLPYGVTHNKWDSILPLDKLWDEYKRIIKDDGVICLTAIQPFTSMLVMSNLKMFRYEWIWHKPHCGALNAKKQPLRTHESILIFYKKFGIYNPQFEAGEPYVRFRKHSSSNYGSGQKPCVTINNGIRYPKSIIKFNKDKDKVHPTQKPVALFEYLIRTYTNEGMIVLDNTAGVCTTGIAAENTNRYWICIEKEEKYCELGKKRLLD